MAAKSKGLGRGLSALLGKPEENAEKEQNKRPEANKSTKQAARTSKKQASTKAEKAAQTDLAKSQPQSKEEATVPKEEAKEKTEKHDVESPFQVINIHQVEPKEDQPRQVFDREKLEELATSIREHGIIQPLIVTRVQDHFQIVAGERRWRAAQMVGIHEVPVIIRGLSEKDVLQQALIENIQRQDLNPIETAEALARLQNEHQMTQEELSSSVGMSRPALANLLRLLRLPQKIQGALQAGSLSQGHARALLSLENEEQMQILADEIVNKQLSVRQTEKLIKRLLSQPKERRKVDELASIQTQLEFQAIEERLHRVLGTKVNLKNNKRSGQIIIEYYSLDELERLLQVFENGHKLA